MLAQMIKNRGLQPAEAEVEGIPSRFRWPKFHRCGRSVRSGSQTVENRPARVSQAKHLRDFVVAFARCIVTRLSQLAVMKKRARIWRGGVFSLHFVQNGVATGNDQTDGRQFGCAPGFV